MIKFLIGLIGLFIGGLVGFAVACIMQAQEMDDE